MKKLLSVLVLLLAVVFATAQTPKINYQAVVRDSHNRLVANTTIQVEVTVTYSGGTYSENLSGTTNANGLLSLEIGGGINFNLIDWSTATIQTTAHLPGNETLQDVVNVTAVPLALHAEYADSVNLNVIANYLNSHDIPSGTGVNVQSDWNQTDTQADDYIKNKPTKLTDFTNDANYATKTEVTTNVDSVKGNLRNEIATKANTADVYNKEQSDIRYLQSYTETDPTVPDWAKSPNPPAGSGTLNTSNTNALDVNSSEALSGDVKLHKISKTGSYTDLNNKPDIEDSISGYLNEHKYVTNATCDSLDFCALMGKVNTLVEGVNELNYALEDLSNLVGVLYGFIDSLGHVIDSLGGVIEELSGDTPPTTVEPVGSFNGKSTIDADGANNAQNVGYAGQYRSSDYEENSIAYSLQFYQGQINPATGAPRNRGRSVRLVKDAE